MKAFKEIFIPGILWAYFLSEGIRGGLTVPELKMEPNDEMPINFQIIVYAMSLSFGFIITYINNIRTSKTFIDNILGKIFTEESFNIMMSRTKPYLLAGLFFGLIGVIGIIKSKIIGAPILNQQILISPGLVGVGIIIGWLLSNYQKEKRAS